jgi:mannose-6-phosphate isomerase-like protein (cupin superfamily)
MITKFRMSEAIATAEFGMACQRLVPWAGQGDEPPFGVMACFLQASGASDPDCHDQDEVMIVLSGAGTVDIAGEYTEIEGGDIVVIPRDKPHVVRNGGDPTLHWVSFYWPLHEPDGGRSPEGTA